jgi:hypothetical protein
VGSLFVTIPLPPTGLVLSLGKLAVAPYCSNSLLFIVVIMPNGSCRVKNCRAKKFHGVLTYGCGSFYKLETILIKIQNMAAKNTPNARPSKKLAASTTNGNKYPVILVYIPNRGLQG